jgi:hypothetical protein
VIPAEPGPPTCLTCRYIHGEAMQHWCTHPNGTFEEFDPVYGTIKTRRVTCREQRGSLAPGACGPTGKWWVLKVSPPLPWWQRLIDRIMR